MANFLFGWTSDATNRYKQINAQAQEFQPNDLRGHEAKHDGNHNWTIQEGEQHTNTVRGNNNTTGQGEKHNTNDVEGNENKTTQVGNDNDNRTKGNKVTLSEAGIKNRNIIEGSDGSVKTYIGEGYDTKTSNYKTITRRVSTMKLFDQEVWRKKLKAFWEWARGEGKGKIELDPDRNQRK